MKKKHPEHVNLERWLVSYADFITLLFAFFVVMYAISQSDKAKLAAIAQAMRTAFGQSAGPVGMIDLGGGGGGPTLNQFAAIEVPGGRVLNLPAGKTNVAADEDPGLQDVRDKLEESISLEAGTTSTSDKLQMQYDSRGLVLRLAAKDLFPPGEAKIRPDFLPLLDRIGKTLGSTRRLMRFEGHADSSEARPKGYSSAWELSFARALAVSRYLLGRYDIEPRRVGVAGYGYNRPLSEKDDVYSQASNRRVEIILLNNRYLDDELNLNREEGVKASPTPSSEASSE
jgi:chemotaxis protein MotB